MANTKDSPEKLWHLPSFDTHDGSSRSSKSPTKDQLKPPTAEEINAIRTSAFEEGKAEGVQQGLKDGLVQAEKNYQLLQQSFNHLMDSFSEPLNFFDLPHFQLPFEPVEIIGSQSGNQNNYAQEPGSPPKRGLNKQLKCGRLRIPNAIVVGGLYF